MKDWFLSELRSIAAPSDAARYALDLSNQSVTLLERRFGGLRERNSVSYGAPDFAAQITAMRRMVSRSRSAEARVDIMLPRELVLNRIETFPAEARGALRDEAWWRLDAMTPYKPESLCYDVALIGVDPRSGFLEVSIALAPRDVVDEAIGYARSWGFAPQRITCPPSEEFPNGPLLLQASDARLETQSLRRSAVWFAAAAAVMAAIGVWRGVAERQAIAATLEERQAQAEQTLSKATRIKGATLAFVESSMQPMRRRREQRSALEWLDAITEALPPGAVAERIVMFDGLVRLEGVTDRPQGVLSALESAPAFSGVRYAAPLAAVEGGRDRRRFVIEARLTAAEPDA